MKGVDSHNLHTLDYHPHPSRRRSKFNAFLDKLKLVTSSVRQTKKLLSDTSNPTPLTHKGANKAFFRMLCAKVDTQLNTKLQNLRNRLGREDGYEALLLLRKLFADVSDIDFQHEALSLFCTIQWRDGETMHTFNRRFNGMHRNVLSAGMEIDEQERIRHYLRALKKHTSTNVLCEVKAHMRQQT